MSIAPNSQNAYKNALGAFTSFRNQYRLPNLYPAPIGHITLFISCCVQLGYSPSTISTYVSGISFYHKIRNQPDPTSVFIVKKMIEGAKRAKTTCDVRSPITDSILRKILNILPNTCYTMYETYLFKAAFLTAYYGLLRVSEITHTSPLQAHRPLALSDIHVENCLTAIQITIRFSKTCQRGTPTTLRIPATNDPSFCCVSAMRKFLNKRPVSSGILFCHENGSPLTRSQFSGVLAKL